MCFSTCWLWHGLRATTERIFFEILTSKSGPRPSVFNALEFQICLAPQRHALFEHLNFSKCFDHGVFFTCAWRRNSVHLFNISTSKNALKMACFVHFDFGMCFCATAPCTFWTSQLPKVLWAWCFLTCCLPNYSKLMCFAPQPSGATKHRKKQVFRDFSTFSRTFILSLSLFSDLLSSSLLFSDSSHLCFFHPSILYCRKFDC